MKNVLEHTSPALIVEDCSIQMILNMEILEQDFVRTAHRIIKRILLNTNRQYSMVGIFLPKNRRNEIGKTDFNGLYRCL